jgi:SAM domain (Sterile alpha motif)
MRRPMSSVAEWLATLGLSEYTDCFAESDVDVSVLHLLTDQDLKELGVSLYCPAELPSSGDRASKMATYVTFPAAAAAFSTAGTRRCLERQLSYRSKLSPEDTSLIVWLIRRPLAFTEADFRLVWHVRPGIVHAQKAANILAGASN